MQALIAAWRSHAMVQRRAKHHMVQIWLPLSSRRLLVLASRGGAGMKDGLNKKRIQPRA